VSERRALVTRKTKETDIRVSLLLDGSGRSEIATGIGFLDHMLDALARHARLDLEIRCDGDLHVDDHHTAEDVALALGAALDEALGERRGIQRFGTAHAPLDEALARTVIDLSGRPYPVIKLGFQRWSVGEIATENLSHFFHSFAVAGRMALHVEVLYGDNDHHRAEAAFKSLALALRQGIREDGSREVPSTKGSL
jgi:imidazoleglycerol-phosphate dehydratase